MGFNSRKFLIWLISLAVVLAVYLLYSRLSETPQFDIDTAAHPKERVADTVADGNVGEIGMVGDKIGVGKVRKARFTDLDKETKEVIREWGFETLLHEQGDQWEIEKPYMNIFRRNFKSYLTADKGIIQVEDAVGGRKSPKDATFTGNVVIHILPENSSRIQESFIYLDDIVFISERSQFSTAGPVKFISPRVQMLGRGLELLYNDEADRLEFLRIIHLESLRLKSPEVALLSGTAPGSRPPAKTSHLSPTGTDVNTPYGTSNRVQTERLAEPVAADVPQKAKTSPTASRQVVEQDKGKYYRCVFSENVVIDTPEQLIFADEVSINNIFSPKALNNKSDKADTNGKDDVKALDTPVAKHGESSRLDEQFVDVVITCDNGIVVTPMDSSGAPENSTKVRPEMVATDSQSAKTLNDTAGRTTFVAQKIDYCALTGDIISIGPSELTFYADDITGADTNEAPVPVKVTAQKKVEFLPALNQVIFEGDCLCTMLREDPNSRQRYTLSAPKLTIDLSGDKDKQSSTSAAGIEHLAAGGGLVRLATLKTKGEKLLGGIELKCWKFDFDNAQRMFSAAGPGVIKVYNSKISEPDSEPNVFGLEKPCWAIIENFHTLKYFLDANQVIADAEPQGILLINYFPVVEGQVQYDRQVTVTTPHVQANLIETAEGEFILSALSATGGITYEDEDKEFDGGRLFYDGGKSIVTVHGDELQPCHFNGVPVDAVEWDLKTDRVKFEITGPGALQMKSKIKMQKSK